MSKGKELQLPVSRVKTIMKSSPDVENIGQDALHLVTKATELFVQQLSQRAHEISNSRQFEYNQLADVVQASENMTFLREILPKKITVREYRKIVEQNEEMNSDTQEEIN